MLRILRVCFHNSPSGACCQPGGVEPGAFEPFVKWKHPSIAMPTYLTDQPTDSAPQVIEGRDYFGETEGAFDRAGWIFCPLCLRPFSINRWQYMGILPIECNRQCPYSYVGDLRTNPRPDYDAYAHEAEDPKWA